MSCSGEMAVEDSFSAEFDVLRQRADILFVILFTMYFLLMQMAADLINYSYETINEFCYTETHVL